MEDELSHSIGTSTFLDHDSLTGAVREVHLSLPGFGSAAASSTSNSSQEHQIKWLYVKLMLTEPLAGQHLCCAAGGLSSNCSSGGELRLQSSSVNSPIYSNQRMKPIS